MVRFINDNILTHPNDAGIFIIDVDLQGVPTTPEQHQFMNAFPKLKAIYKKRCRFNYMNSAGTTIFIEEGGYKICLMVTKRHRYTKREQVLVNFQSCLNQILAVVPGDMFLYSAILGRKDSCMDEFIAKINTTLGNGGEAPRQWIVCRGESNAHN